MSRELDLGKIAAGAFHLFIGKFVSRLVSGLSGLILIRLFMPSEYGLFSVALIAPSIFFLFSDFGTNSAMVKYLAEYKSKGKLENLKPLVYSNLLLHILLGLFLTLTCYLTADFFAAIVIGKPYVAPLIRVSAFYILAQTLYYFTESTFIGLHFMKGAAIIMILAALLGGSLKVALVVYGMGISGALLGWAAGVITVGSIGIVASALFLPKEKDNQSASPKSDFDYKLALRKMLIFGIPLAAALIALSVVGRFYDFMIAIYGDVGDIGNFSAANKLTSPLFFLAFPISTVLFPTFSMIEGNKNSTSLRKVYSYSVKYSSLVILPAAVLIMVLAQPLTIFLFGVEYEYAWIYLTLLAINWILYGLGWEHLKKLLSAQGKVKLIAYLGALEATVAVSLALILIPMYGIIGVILVSLVAWLPSYIIAAKKSSKEYGIKLPLGDVGRIFFSTIMTGLVVGLVNLVNLNILLKLIFGVFIGIVTYMVFIPASRAIRISDIKALREITRPQPVIGVIIDKILQIMELIACAREQSTDC